MKPSIVWRWSCFFFHLSRAAEAHPAKGRFAQLVVQLLSSQHPYPPSASQKSLGQRLESVLREEKKRGRGKGRAESDVHGFVCIADPFKQSQWGTHCASGRARLSALYCVPLCATHDTRGTATTPACHRRGRLAGIPQLQKGDTGEKNKYKILNPLSQSNSNDTVLGRKCVCARACISY